MLQLLKKWKWGGSMVWKQVFALKFTHILCINMPYIVIGNSFPGFLKYNIYIFLYYLCLFSFKFTGSQDKSDCCGWYRGSDSDWWSNGIRSIFFYFHQQSVRDNCQAGKSSSSQLIPRKQHFMRATFLRGFLCLHLTQFSLVYTELMLPSKCCRTLFNRQRLFKLSAAD